MGTASPDNATKEEDDEPDRTSEHLDDLVDGAGCTEIWEHLSEMRQEDR